MQKGPHAAHREIPHCTPGRTSRRRWPRPFSGNISCIRANRVILIMFFCFCYYYFFLSSVVALPALCVSPRSPLMEQAMRCVHVCAARPLLQRGGSCDLLHYPPPLRIVLPPTPTRPREVSTACCRFNRIEIPGGDLLREEE